MRTAAALLALATAFPLQAAEPKAHRDVAYAQPRSDRQTLDVYAPAEGKNRPVVVWVHGGGWRNVSVCHSLDELIHHYDQSGLLTMVVQEFVKWDQYVRCLCVGQQDVLPMKYDPYQRRYLVEHEHLAPELGKQLSKVIDGFGAGGSPLLHGVDGAFDIGGRGIDPGDEELFKLLADTLRPHDLKGDARIAVPKVITKARIAQGERARPPLLGSFQLSCRNFGLTGVGECLDKVIAQPGRQWIMFERPASSIDSLVEAPDRQEKLGSDCQQVRVVGVEGRSLVDEFQPCIERTDWQHPELCDIRLRNVRIELACLRNMLFDGDRRPAVEADDFHVHKLPFGKDQLSPSGGEFRRLLNDLSEDRNHALGIDPIGIGQDRAAVEVKLETVPGQLLALGGAPFQRAIQDLRGRECQRLLQVGEPGRGLAKFLRP